MKYDFKMIGPRIKATRESLGMSRQELGEEIGCSSQNIRKIEEEQHGLGRNWYDNTEKLADALDVDVLWLLTGKHLEESTGGVFEFDPAQFGTLNKAQLRYVATVICRLAPAFTDDELKKRMGIG